jgi:hypothetical protein
MGADAAIAPAANNFLNNSSVQLSQWQVNDIANASATGYYQNPYTSTLSSLTITLTNMALSCNTSNVTFDTADAQANTLYSTINNTLSSISSFKTHTDCISGVQKSSDGSLYPDLNTALAIGRQVLSLTNKADGVQNNTPVLGNFTSLYIKDQVNSLSTTIRNDSTILLNSIYVLDGNNASNISVSAINSIITDVSSLQTLLDSRRSGDISFYQNSLAVVQDYQTVLTFSNVGATQNSLLQMVGTNKLKTSIQTAQPLPVTVNTSSILYTNPYATTVVAVGSGGGTTSGTGTTTVAASLTATGVNPGTYGSSNKIPIVSVDQYGRVTSITTIGAVGSATEQSIIQFDTNTIGQQVIDTFDSASYRSAKYEVQITSGSYFHVIELRIVHNGVITFMTQYGEIVTDVTLGQFYADVSGGTVKLYLTPTNAFNTVKMIRTLITI